MPEQCNHVLKNGPRAGTQCTTLCTDEYCKSHFLIHYCAAPLECSDGRLCKNPRPSWGHRCSEHEIEQINIPINDINK